MMRDYRLSSVRKEKGIALVVCGNALDGLVSDFGPRTRKPQAKDPVPTASRMVDGAQMVPFGDVVIHCHDGNGLSVIPVGEAEGSALLAVPLPPISLPQMGRTHAHQAPSCYALTSSSAKRRRLVHLWCQKKASSGAFF